MVTRKNKTRQKRDKINKKYKKNENTKKYKKKTQRRYFRRGGAMDITAQELENYFIQYIKHLNGEKKGAFYNSSNLEKMCEEFIVNDDKSKKKQAECWLNKFAQSEKLNASYSRQLQIKILLILGCILGLELKTKHNFNCEITSALRCNTSARPASAAASNAPSQRASASAAASNAPVRPATAAASNAPLQRASDSKPCIKDAGGRGDCFYFSVYEALKERDGLLEKLETKHSSLAIENKDKFMKSFRLRIALSFSVKPSEKYKPSRLDEIFEGLVYHLLMFFITNPKKDMLTSLVETTDYQQDIIIIFIDSFYKIIEDDNVLFRFEDNINSVWNATLESHKNYYTELALLNIMTGYVNSKQYEIFRQKLIKNIQPPEKYSNSFDIKEAIDLLLQAGIKIETIHDKTTLKKKIEKNELPEFDDGLPIIYLYTPDAANHFQYISLNPDFDTTMQCVPV